MKSVIIAIFIYIVTCAQTYAAAPQSSKDAAFPDTYFDGTNNVRKVENPNATESGKIGDKFITNQDSLAKMERGNTSSVVKCPCKKSGGNCGGCHLKPTKDTAALIPAATQYRFIPMPTETDEQMNPYFMMLSRQRLVANTSKFEPMPAPPPPNVPSKAQIIQPSFSTGLIYKFISGGALTGSGQFTSSETAGTGTAGNVTASSSEVDNFRIDKNYSRGGSKFLSLGGGIKLNKFLRGEISTSINKLSGDATITNLRGYTFDTSNSYGNGYLYMMGLTGYIDIMSDTKAFYPSFGAGIHTGYLNLPELSTGGAISSLYTLSAHLNFVMDSNTVFFAGIKRIMSKQSYEFESSYTETTTSTSLSDARILADRSVTVDPFTLSAIEIGFRFY